MRSSPFTVFLAFALLVEGRAVAKTELLKTQLGALVHWSQAEITVGVDPSARSRSLSVDTTAAAVQRATEAWNRVPAGQPRLRFVPDGTANVLIQFCKGHWHGEAQDVGNTQFTASTQDGTVNRAMIFLNERDHAFVAPGELPRGRANLQSVMTHELGHVFGLGHSDDPATIMYPSGGGATMYRPTLDDATALALIYLGRSSRESSVSPSASRLAARQTGPLAVESTMAPRQLPGSGKEAAGNDQPPMPPTDSVSVLTLTAANGRQLMLYTCEPTLLPPMAMAPTSKDPKRPHSGTRRQTSPY